MRYDLLEADFALSLPHREAEKPESSVHWTGWKKHWWPVDDIKPRERLYVFDKGTRRYCALLEVTEGGSFTYRTQKEFEHQVHRLIHEWPRHDVPHWSRIPFGKGKKPYTGFAIKWKVIKRVDMPGDHKFPRIGFERLGSSEGKETTRKQLSDSRRGQGKFRENVLSHWKGACAVTGCKTRSVLKASHIKPWQKSNSRERLDPFNGLALIPNLDTAFDRGLVSFLDNGRILVSSNLDRETQATLGISSRMRINKHLDVRHLQYLKYHREEVFQK